jgi:hypothetical protein
MVFVQGSNLEQKPFKFKPNGENERLLCRRRHGGYESDAKRTPF